MSIENCHQGHRERLRERYEENGLDGFADHEVLELLLGYSIARKDTNPIAHELIDRYGHLYKVMNAPKAELTQISDMGEYSAFLIKLVVDICRRYYEQQVEKRTEEIHDTDDLGTYFIPCFIGRPEECFYAAFFDASHRMIACGLQFQGTANAVEIHVPTLVKRALKMDAKFVVLAHNHFLDATPSLQDMKATACAYRALEEYQIKLVDHYIVCGTEVNSMKQSGHFKKMIRE